MSRTVMRGSRLAYGSWKIICISWRAWRSRAPLAAVMSSPSSSTRPEVGSSSRITSRAVVDLPDPDSPTSPSVSPLRMVNDTPSTAWTDATSRWKTTPSMTGKCLTRSVTRTRSCPARGATASRSVATLI